MINPTKKPPDFRADIADLVRIVVPHCLMPHPDVVAAVGGAVFPAIRAGSTTPRMTVGTVDGRQVMYDDNMTPRWAMLWTHGFASTGHPKGWTFAHVWQRSKDPDAYTHPANLVLMPEPFASLSDKQGPLTTYFRYHAQKAYGWRPSGEPLVREPAGYRDIKWTYLNPHPDPMGVVWSRMAALDNQRVNVLRSILRRS